MVTFLAYLISIREFLFAYTYQNMAMHEMLAACLPSNIAVILSRCMTYMQNNGGLAREMSSEEKYRLYARSGVINSILMKWLADGKEESVEEIVAQAQKVLDRVCEKYGHTIDYTDILMGGCSIDACGVPLTDEAIEAAKSCQAVLMGSIGGDAATSPWYRLAPELRPEAGLLKIRKALGLYANLRPAYLYKELADACPLAAKDGGRSFDLIIVRELTGGLYFGDRYTKVIDGVETAVDTLKYDEKEIRRIAKTAFDIAMKRGRKVCSVDKANVLDTSRLWRKVVAEVAKDYPEVELSNMLVDNCAMQLVKEPEQFDVIVTENMFGDILSDEASMITGSIGMLSSASLNETSFGLYEPSHGSAPDIAGKNIANPIATILSAAMMLRYTFGLQDEAAAIENAVQKAITDGYRSFDLMPRGETGSACTEQKCDELGDRICERI